MMTQTGYRAVACAAFLIATACNHTPASPTRPSDPPARTDQPTSITISVTDGWTGAPVQGARISAEDGERLTDADGRAPLAVRTTSCAPITILAMGFLERRTCAKPEITLWPVGDEREVAATRAAAFVGDRLRVWTSQAEVVPSADMLERPDLVATWRETAAEIRGLTSGKLPIQIVAHFSGDEGFVVRLAGVPPGCTASRFDWNFALAGFCVEATPEYFVDNINIPPDGGDRAVALRALLYAFALRPHPLPGLMNRTQPANELSEFEKKTLRMQSLRSPIQVTWPDIDPTR